MPISICSDSNTPSALNEARKGRHHETVKLLLGRGTDPSNPNAMDEEAYEGAVHTLLDHSMQVPARQFKGYGHLNALCEDRSCEDLANAPRKGANVHVACHLEC